MLKLYGGARSRAAIVQWYLEELQTPYEYILLKMREEGEHLKPEFLAINPFGKVPVIVDGDLTLSESGAILLYLAKKHGQIPDNLEQEGLLYQWVLFANSTLVNGVFLESNREREMPKLMSVLNDIFNKQDFITGSSFTVADVAIASVLAFIPLMLNISLSEYDGITSYLTRIKERPAYQKVMGTGS